MRELGITHLGSVSESAIYGMHAAAAADEPRLCHASDHDSLAALLDELSGWICHGTKYFKKTLGRLEGLRASLRLGEGI